MRPGRVAIIPLFLNVAFAAPRHAQLSQPTRFANVIGLGRAPMVSVSIRHVSLSSGFVLLVVEGWTLVGASCVAPASYGGARGVKRTGRNAFAWAWSLQALARTWNPSLVLMRLANISFQRRATRRGLARMASKMRARASNA